MALTLRPATLTDKPRILEISSRIWEGEDYIPAVIDEWLAAENSELALVLLDDQVISFARFTWLLPGYGWIEGLRADPAYQGLGAGKALTRYFLEKARQAGAHRIGLSTYIENYASLHIIESHGFRRVAEFVGAEAEPDDLLRQAEPVAEVVAVPPAEAIPFIRASTFLELAQGYFPCGWQFYPFAQDPAYVLAQMRYVLGLRRAGRLIGLLCCGRLTHGPAEFSVDFLDGEPEAIVALTRHALSLARGVPWFMIPVPKAGPRAAPALEQLLTLGFTTWQAGTADIFVYEQALAAE